MLSRFAKRPLELALSQFRVVAIVGSRQVGKSTLAEGFAGRHFVTLDDLGALNAAEADPRSFIRDLPRPATIDEIQRVPKLMLAIKELVDKERRPGSFLVTGSSRLDTLRGLRESLAGRMALFHLRPMIAQELAGHPDTSLLDRLFDCRDLRSVTTLFSKAKPLTGVDKKSFLKGGFPEPALHLNQAGRRAWFREYRKSYIERDIPALLHVEELPSLIRFLTACASSTAQLVNTTKLASDIGISVDTARRWIGIFESTFIAERRTPYWRNVRHRLVKSPKLFVCDAGLAASLCGIDSWPTGENAAAAGHLLETWVHNQLATLADLAETELHFYRTHSQVEVDFVLARPGKLIGVEVKHNATAKIKDAAGIDSLSMFKDFRFGIVLYLGDSVIPLSANAVAVPLPLFFGA